MEEEERLILRGAVGPQPTSQGPRAHHLLALWVGRPLDLRLPPRTGAIRCPFD